MLDSNHIHVITYLFESILTPTESISVISYLVSSLSQLNIYPNMLKRLFE